MKAAVENGSVFQDANSAENDTVVVVGSKKIGVATVYELLCLEGGRAGRTVWELEHRLLDENLWERCFV